MYAILQQHHSHLLGERVAAVSAKYSKNLQGSAGGLAGLKALAPRKGGVIHTAYTVSIDCAQHVNAKGVSSGYLYVVCPAAYISTPKVKFKASPSWNFTIKVKPQDIANAKKDLQFELRCATSGQPKGVCTLASILEDPSLLSKADPQKACSSLLDVLEYSNRADKSDKLLGVASVDISGLTKGEGMYDIFGWYHVIDGIDTVAQLKVRVAPADNARQAASTSSAAIASPQAAPDEAKLPPGLQQLHRRPFSAVYDTVDKLAMTTSHLLLPPFMAHASMSKVPNIMVAPFSDFTNRDFVALFQSGNWAGKAGSVEFQWALQQFVEQERRPPIDASLLQKTFSAFDEVSGGEIQWRRVLLGMSVLCRGTVEEQLRVVFQMLDCTGTGRITRGALIEFFQAILEPQLVDAWSLESMIDRLILDMDRTGRGSLAMEELLAWSGNSVLLDCLQRFVQRMTATILNLGGGAKLHGSDARPTEFHSVSSADAQRALESEALACGSVTYLEVDRVLRRLLSLSPGLSSSTFVEKMFHLFDHEAYGTIHWGSFVCGLMFLVNGAREEKLGAILNLLSRGTGIVDENTLELFLRATSVHPEDIRQQHLDHIQKQIMEPGVTSVSVSDLLVENKRKVLTNHVDCFNHRFDLHLKKLV